MAPLDADRQRRAALERREQAVAAREAELAGRRRLWRALLWRAQLVPLRIVEIIVGTWLTVAALAAGSQLLSVSAFLSGVLLVAAAILSLAG
jgi:hypothetical protein